MILDTCALLWLAHDQTKLSAQTLKQIDEAPVVSISSITGFEICLKNKSGKLELPAPPREWLTLVLKFYHIDIIDLDLQICVRATELPDIHRDPCDRFIIATGMIRGLPIVTADRLFSEYGVSVMI